jgi:hypothetical protein
MKIITTLSAVLLCSCAVLFAQDAPATQPARTPIPPTATSTPADLQKLFVEKIDAFKTKDYKAFISNSDEAFSKAATEVAFGEACDEWAPRLSPGFETSYMGAFKKGDYTVTLWKLVCADKGDDLLVTMSVKDGKVGGFFIN